MITTWCSFCRETTDTYTIAASPIFGYLGPSTSKYSIDGGRSGLASDLRLPFISDKLESVKSLRRHLLGSVRDEKLSFQYTGEIYVGQGCSVTQTVFNGNYKYPNIEQQGCSVNYKYAHI
uniref:Uncharacterized protein n=1 Tax=Aegilops tauschii subsp. strangulata TaxID=200361 RepID=A0A453PTH1_AEGTS